MNIRPTLLLATVLAVPSAATAVPIQFDFSSTVTLSGIPGVTAGVGLSLEVVADNGNDSLLNQVWLAADVQRISVDIGNGTYTAEYNTPPSELYTHFETDLAGALTLASIADCCDSQTGGTENGVPTNDPNLALGLNTVQDVAGNFAFFFPFADSLSNWSIAQGAQPPGPPLPDSAIVPEPASLALFGIGLAGIGLRRRISRRKLPE